MIATDHFTFVHLHKCGGSFVSQFLLRFIPSARRVGYHYPLSARPASEAGRPVLGCVRNPWDFYVSYHAFQCEVLAGARRQTAAMSGRELAEWTAAGNDPLNGVDALFLELSDGATNGLAPFTRALLRIGSDDHLLERVLRVMPVEFDRRDRSPAIQVEGFRGMNVRASDLARIRGTGLGLCTFLFDHLYGDAPGVTYLRMEHLREDLVAYLRQVGVPVTDEMRRYLIEAVPLNASRHAPYPEYYDRALADRVQQCDGDLARRFGYQFDAVASRR
jgi:hypothetical protein